MDRVTRGRVPAQRVEVETRKVHIFGSLRAIEGIQAA